MADRAGLVTGGGSGIGRALARALAQEGYDLTISGRDAGKLEAVAEELRGEGVAVQPVSADLGDATAIARLIEAHRAAYGRMDVLVNAAADGSGRGTVAEVDPEVVERHLNVNLGSLFTTLRHSLGMLEAAGAEHGKALVVNVGSAAAKSGAPGLSFYAAAKAGVAALTRTAQMEERHAGIQFTTFTPGFTATPMAVWLEHAGISHDELVQPDDLGEALRFLLRTSPTCHVPEIEFSPPSQGEIIQRLMAFRAG